MPRVAAVLLKLPIEANEISAFSVSLENIAWIYITKYEINNTLNESVLCSIIANSILWEASEPRVSMGTVMPISTRVAHVGKL